MFKLATGTPHARRNDATARPVGDVLTSRSGEGVGDPLGDSLVGRAPPVQRAVGAGAAPPPATDAGVRSLAGRGTSGAGQPLPHAERIQASFGHHDLGDVKAHVGGSAGEAAGQMGAVAFASGRHVAFREGPDLHTAAHEAAHVVQQRGGVSLKGGVGRAGDPHERHADAVADAVVAGRSAEALLDRHAPGGAGPTKTVQAKTWWEAAQGPAYPTGLVTAPRIWFRTSPQTIDGNHLMLVDRDTRVDVIDANVPTQDVDEWRLKRPKWAKVRVGFLEGYLPADVVQIVAPATGAEGGATPPASGGGAAATSGNSTPAATGETETGASGGSATASKTRPEVTGGADVSGALAATGHLAKMMAKDEFKQIPAKPDGALFQGIVRAFQQWLDAGCREKALDYYARKKAKSIRKELEARSTAKDLAAYHVQYTCNFFTQFMLSNGDWLRTLNGDRTMPYEAFKTSVEARIAEYFARRLIGPEGEGSVRFDGRVMRDEGIKDVADAWDNGSLERKKGESGKDFAKRKKEWTANKEGRKADAMEAWKARSGKSADDFGEKCAQVLQYEGQMIRITVRQAKHNKKNGELTFLYYNDGKPRYHFFAGFVTRGEQPMLVTYDHQNNPERVGPFPLLDPHGAKNSHYFWSTFQSAVPQS